MSDPASALRLEEVTVGVETMLTRVRAGKLSMAAVSMGLADTADTLRALLAATEPAPEPVSNAYTLPEEVQEAAAMFARMSAAWNAGDTDAKEMYRRGQTLLSALAALAALAARGGRP